MNTSLFGFFRHQFTALPLSRLFWMVPLGLMFALGTAFSDFWVTVVMCPAFVTLFVFGALSPEESPYSAYGLPRERRVRLTAMAAVPAVLLGVALALLLQPGWLGLLGALGSVAIGLLLGWRFVDGSQARGRERVRDRLGSHGFLFELVWKPQLLWATGIAFVQCVTSHLASRMGEGALGQWFGVLPLLVWYFMYCVGGAGVPGPDAGASYGVPRKRWLGVSLAATGVSVLQFAVIVGLVAPAGVSRGAVAAWALGGFACAVLGAMMKTRRSDLGLLPPMLMYFPASQLHASSEIQKPELIYFGVVAAILLLAGVALQVAYLGGYMNPRAPSKNR